MVTVAWRHVARDGVQRFVPAEARREGGVWRLFDAAGRAHDGAPYRTLTAIERDWCVRVVRCGDVARLVRLEST